MSKLVATALGIGYVSVAPGTLASLATLPLAILVYAVGGFVGYALLTAGVLVAGFASVAEASRSAGVADPAEIVIDEVAGQLISLFPLPLGLWLHGSNVLILPWPGVLAAFVLFRAFDILKPWPIRQIDSLQSPASIMLDDIAAGILAALLVAILGAVAHDLTR